MNSRSCVWLFTVNNSPCSSQSHGYVANTDRLLLLPVRQEPQGEREREKKRDEQGEREREKKRDEQGERERRRRREMNRECSKKYF